MNYEYVYENSKVILKLNGNTSKFLGRGIIFFVQQNFMDRPVLHTAKARLFNSLASIYTKL